MLLTLAYNDYVKTLNIYAFFKVHDSVISEDLVQVTFMKTWNYLLKGGKIDVMKAFLYHILNCLIIDEYRKNKTTSLDILFENGFEPINDDTDHLLNTLDGKALIILIQKLPEKYKKIMSMRYKQNLSLKEMSVITGQTKNTIAVQVHRGIEKLKILSSQNKVNIS